MSDPKINKKVNKVTDSTDEAITKLETLLVEGFSAEGDDFAAKVRGLGHDLPEDLRDLLLELAGEQNRQGSSLAFAFRCGQAYERLESLAQSRLAAHIAFLDPDGTPPLELEKNDLDAIARFVNLRNRFLKTVADYTLKFLLVSVILLVLGLSLGLI